MVNNDIIFTSKVVCTDIQIPKSVYVKRLDLTVGDVLELSLKLKDKCSSTTIKVVNTKNGNTEYFDQGKFANPTTFPFEMKNI